MSDRRKPHKQPRPPCARLESDDGIDPRELFRESRREGDDRKTRQLCKQVYRILHCALGACGDPVVQDLVVESVAPAPDASRLLVSVRPGTLSGGARLELAAEALNRVRGMLRREVAAGIHRRKAPELVYRMVGRQEGSP